LDSYAKIVLWLSAKKLPVTNRKCLYEKKLILQDTRHKDQKYGPVFLIKKKVGPGSPTLDTGTIRL
jgi:hypothetical protein